MSEHTASNYGTKIALKPENLLSFLRGARTPEGAEKFQCDPVVSGYISEVHEITGALSTRDAAELKRVQQLAGQATERAEHEFKEEVGVQRAQRRGEAKEQADVDGELFVRMVTALEKANGWFIGLDGHLSMTHSHDDWKKGTDLVLTLYRDVVGPDGPTRIPVHVAIDMTVAKSDDVLDKKLDRIFERLTHGKMASIPYFEDPETRQRKKLDMVPQVVVVIGEEGFEKLRTITTQYFTGENRVWGEETGFPKAFLDIILAQLKAQQELLERASAAGTLPPEVTPIKAESMRSQLRPVIQALEELRQSQDIAKLGRWELDQRQRYLVDTVKNLAA